MKNKAKFITDVSERLKSGESRASILASYTDLGEQRLVAQVMATIPPIGRKNTYRKVVYLLLGMLILSWASMIAVNYLIHQAEMMIAETQNSYSVQGTTFNFWGSSIFSHIIPAFTIFSVFRFQALGLRFVYILLSLNLSPFLRMLTSEELALMPVNGDFIILLLPFTFLLLSTCLAFYLDIKLFPDLGFIGPKKKVDGSFQLTEI